MENRIKYHQDCIKQTQPRALQRAINANKKRAKTSKNVKRSLTKKTRRSMAADTPFARKGYKIHMLFL